MDEQEQVVENLLLLLTKELNLDLKQAYLLGVHLRCVYDLGYREGRSACSHRKQVEQFDLKKREIVNTYKSVSQAAKAMRIERGSMSNIIIRKTNHKGYRFRFTK